MADFENSPMAYEETKYRAQVELHDLSEESFIERKYMGTDADRHDMIVLGRKQVLRVYRNSHASQTAMKLGWHLGICADGSVLSVILHFYQWSALPPSLSLPGSFSSRKYFI